MGKQADMQMGTGFGAATARLIDSVLGARADHAVVLMRHSAREFAPGVHDLANPLTSEGRDLAVQLGAALPKDVTVRGYASPPERCMETAELIIAGHRDRGGAATRHRPVEGLGVFYALDQMKMWRALSAAGGLVPFVEGWVGGDVPVDAMIPAEVAADLILRLLAARLADPVHSRQLDICVSHDLTLYMMRHVLLDEPPTGPAVQFLDALVLYRADGETWLTSQHGEPVAVSARLVG